MNIYFSFRALSKSSAYVLSSFLLYLAIISTTYCLDYITLILLAFGFRQWIETPSWWWFRFGVIWKFECSWQFLESYSDWHFLIFFPQADIGLPYPQRVVQLPEIVWDQYTNSLGNFEREFKNRKRHTRRVKLVFDKGKKLRANNLSREIPGKIFNNPIHGLLFSRFTC